MSKPRRAPVTRAISLQRKLHEAVDASEWDRCIELAGKICKQIKLALDPKTCQTGIPHLDGVYSIGTMRYERGPKDVVRAINKMNRIIKTAKRTLK